MTVAFLINCRNEKLLDQDYWMDLETNECGAALTFPNVVIHLTSEQLDSIMKGWSRNEKRLTNEIAKNVLGRKRKANEKIKN